MCLTFLTYGWKIQLSHRFANAPWHAYFSIIDRFHGADDKGRGADGSAADDDGADDNDDEDDEDDDDGDDDADDDDDDQMMVRSVISK